MRPTSTCATTTAATCCANSATTPRQETTVFLHPYNSTIASSPTTTSALSADVVVGDEAIVELYGCRKTVVSCLGVVAEFAQHVAAVVVAHVDVGRIHMRGVVDQQCRAVGRRIAVAHVHRDVAVHDVARLRSVARHVAVRGEVAL